MKTKISPPPHTYKQVEKIEQNGDIIACEGSKITWNINLENTTTSCFILNNKKIQSSKRNEIIAEAIILEKSNYSIIVNNNNLTDTLTYFIEVIKDQFPKIKLESTTYDTINENHLFKGLVQDDYLVNKLEFIYSYKNKDSLIVFSKDVFIDRKNTETFFFAFNFSDLNIAQGMEVDYYFKVWDNDAVNGSKFTKSTILTYRQKSLSDLTQTKDLENHKTKQGINQSIELAKEIDEEIISLNKKILEKKEIGCEERQ